MNDDEAGRIRALAEILREFDLDAIRVRVGETEYELVAREPAPAGTVVMAAGAGASRGAAPGNAGKRRRSTARSPGQRQARYGAGRRRLLRRALARCRSVRHGRRPRGSGSGVVHSRSDEADERNHERVRRRDRARHSGKRSARFARRRSVLDRTVVPTRAASPNCSPTGADSSTRRTIRSKSRRSSRRWCGVSQRQESLVVR